MTNDLSIPYEVENIFNWMDGCTMHIDSRDWTQAHTNAHSLLPYSAVIRGRVEKRVVKVFVYLVIRTE